MSTLSSSLKASIFLPFAPKFDDNANSPLLHPASWEQDSCAHSLTRPHLLSGLITFLLLCPPLPPPSYSPHHPAGYFSDVFWPVGISICMSSHLSEFPLCSQPYVPLRLISYPCPAQDFEATCKHSQASFVITRLPLDSTCSPDTTLQFSDALPTVTELEEFRETSCVSQPVLS